MELRTRVAWQTDKGRVRQGNEDAVGARFARSEWERSRRGDLFVVCDGMGGHAGGEIAAQLAVDRILDEYFQGQAGEPVEALVRAVRRASETIRERSAAQPELAGMGCTCVAAAICGDRLVIAHVGDSRAYLLRNAQLRQLTEDHSWVSEQVRAGFLAAEEAATHPLRNVVTRALGMDQPLDVTTEQLTLAAGDVLLLCSDGLSGVLPDRAIAKRLASGDDPGQIANQLIEDANAAGSPDNVTVLVARVDAAPTPDARQPGKVRRRVLLALFGLGCAGLGFFAGVEVMTVPALLQPSPAVTIPAASPVPTTSVTPSASIAPEGCRTCAAPAFQSTVAAPTISATPSVGTVSSPTPAPTAPQRVPTPTP